MTREEASEDMPRRPTLAILYKWIPQNFFADLMSYISRGVKVRSGLGLGVRLGLGLGVRLGYGVG